MGDERHQAYIVIDGPGHDGTTLPLREGITSFGRLPSNDVILLGDLVSRHHSRITFFEGRATLQDLGSHNGSWVNGERVNTRVLKEGDIARVGNFKVAFHVGPVEAARSAARYNETTAAETRTGDGSMPPASKSVLIREIEQARSGEAGGARALHLLYRASDALARALDIESYLEDILSLALEQTPAQLAAYIAVEGDSHRIVSAIGPSGPSRNPIVSLSVVRWVTTKNFPVTTDDVGADLRFGGPPSGVDGPRAVVCVPVSGERGVVGALYLGRDDGPFSDTDLDALSAIAHLSVVGIERAETRRSELAQGAIKDALVRFFGRDVVEVLTRTPTPRMEPKTATVLSCDLQGFSGVLERLSVDQVTDLLSRYVAQIDEVVDRNKGTVDSVVGTRIVATFGAPFSHGNDAARAVSAALEMRAAVDGLLKQRGGLGGRRLSIGIDTGWLLSGVVGSSDRLTYTVAGETVNAAMRLESSAAPGAILMGEGTMSAVRQMFEVRQLGLAQVRGRSEPVQVYEVLGRRTGRRR